MTYYLIKVGKLYLRYDGNNLYQLVPEQYASQILRLEQAEDLKELTGGSLVKYLDGQ